MSKGFNSILFDFDSIVDKEISTLRFLTSEYKESEQLNSLIDISRTDDIDIMKFRRMYGKEDLFRSCLMAQDYKDQYDDILNSLFARDQRSILTSEYAFNTSMTVLISGYRKAGNGTIKTSIRCDNQDQEAYIRTFDKDVSIIVMDRKDVDMSKYGRLVVGHYKSALEYNLNEPKSILVLNFRENFDSNDITLLMPELVISLGDIHNIEIISAYREEFING